LDWLATPGKFYNPDGDDFFGFVVAIQLGSLHTSSSAHRHGLDVGRLENGLSVQE